MSIRSKTEVLWWARNSASCVCSSGPAGGRVRAAAQIFSRSRAFADEEAGYSQSTMKLHCARALRWHTLPTLSPYEAALQPPSATAMPDSASASASLLAAPSWYLAIPTPAAATRKAYVRNTHGVQERTSSPSRSARLFSHPSLSPKPISRLRIVHHLTSRHMGPTCPAVSLLNRA